MALRRGRNVIVERTLIMWDIGQNETREAADPDFVLDLTGKPRSSSHSSSEFLASLNTSLLDLSSDSNDDIGNAREMKGFNNKNHNTKKNTISSRRLNELGLRKSDGVIRNSIDSSFPLPVPRSRSVNDLFAQPRVNNKSIKNIRTKKKIVLHRNVKTASSDSFVYDLKRDSESDASDGVVSQTSLSTLNSSLKRNSQHNQKTSPGPKINNRSSYTKAIGATGKKKRVSSSKKLGPFDSVLQVLEWYHKQQEKNTNEGDIPISSGLSDIFENVYRPVLQHLTIYATEPCTHQRECAPGSKDFNDAISARNAKVKKNGKDNQNQTIKSIQIIRDIEVEIGQEEVANDIVDKSLSQSNKSTGFKNSGGIDKSSSHDSDSTIQASSVYSSDEARENEKKMKIDHSRSSLKVPLKVSSSLNKLSGESDYDDDDDWVDYDHYVDGDDDFNEYSRFSQSSISPLNSPKIIETNTNSNKSDSMQEIYEKLMSGKGESNKRSFCEFLQNVKGSWKGKNKLERPEIVNDLILNLVVTLTALDLFSEGDITLELASTFASYMCDELDGRRF